MGFNCLKARDTLRGGSLLFTTMFPEIPGTRSIRGIWPQEPYRYPASIPPISAYEIFEYIGQDREMSPNGNHYIFSVDLTMFSLSCINLYILNMHAKTTSYRPFSQYSFFP